MKINFILFILFYLYKNLKRKIQRNNNQCKIYFLYLSNYFFYICYYICTIFFYTIAFIIIRLKLSIFFCFITESIVITAAIISSLNFVLVYFYKKHVKLIFVNIVVFFFRNADYLNACTMH